MADPGSGVFSGGWCGGVVVVPGRLRGGKSSLDWIVPYSADIYGANSDVIMDMKTLDLSFPSLISGVRDVFTMLMFSPMNVNPDQEKAM